MTETGSQDPSRARARRPWWILPILGRIPDVEQRHISLLGVMAMALLFEEYDLAMLTAALPFIAGELGMAEADFGWWLGIIRLGALPAFALIPFADRMGRRRVFLASLVGTGLATFATAFSQNTEQFVFFQMITRTFFISGSAVAFVIITEEFPAAHRGWGIGMLGALSLTGHGLAMLLFAQIEHLPGGWRALYVVGIVPVLLFPLFRKRVPETERYRKHNDQRNAAVDEGRVAQLLGPVLELTRTHPARALGIAAVGFLSSVGTISAFQFTGYYTITIHGWTPGQYSAMVILAGGLGIGGNIAAGYLGDRIGRRLIGFVLLGAFPIWVAIFYNSSGWVIAVVWIFFVFSSSGGRVILRALSTELFPTSQRASASGLFAVLDALGAAAGLFLLYGLDRAGQGDLVTLTPILALATGVGGALLFFFPETKQRELETIG